MSRLINEDPQGRLDVLFARVAQHTAEHVGAGEIYNVGLGEIVDEMIRRTIPSRVFTPVDVADAVGILPPAKRRSAKGGARGLR